VPLEPLISALDDQHWYVRASAVEASGKQGDRIPIETLLSAFYDEDISVRTNALTALGRRVEQVPLELFVAALGDEAFSVREVAIEVLRMAAPAALTAVVPEAMAMVQGKPGGTILGSLTQMHIIDTINKLALPLVPFIAKLTTLLDWPYWHVRVRATQTLGKLHHNIPDATIERLHALHNDPVKAVRQAASAALTTIMA